LVHLPTSPLVLFLGAGASAPLGKMLMNEFVAAMSSKPEFSENELFQEITAKDADLEFLLEELQDLERKDYLRDRDSLGHALSTRGQSFELPPVQPRSNWYARNAAPLRRQVEREVYHSYKTIDLRHRHKVQKHFRPLLNLIMKSLRPEDPVIIFTTNYDPAIELLCEQLRRASVS